MDRVSFEMFVIVFFGGLALIGGVVSWLFTMGVIDIMCDQIEELSNQSTTKE